MLPLMRQSGSRGERGGVCIGHQNRAAKKNPSGFSEPPKSVMINVKWFMQGTDFLSRVIFPWSFVWFGKPVLFFLFFFIFSSARSSCFHKSEIFICPILLQNNNSSPEFFPFCRNFTLENVMNMFDNYFTVFTHIFQDFLITQIAGIKNTKSENFIVDFMTEKAQEIKIFTFFFW